MIWWSATDLQRRRGRRGCPRSCAAFVVMSVLTAVWAQVVSASGQQQQLDYEGPWHAAIALDDRLAEESPGWEDVLTAAESALVLGRAGRALEILSRYELPDSLASGAPLAVAAGSRYLLGEYADAGRLFDEASEYASGVRRAVLQTRAAESYERAGMRNEAAIHYRVARQQFPEAGGWLALREARLISQPGVALALVSLAPPGSELLRAAVRADIMAASGDTAGAVRSLVEVEKFADAARLALLSHRTQRARELVYEALSRSNRGQAVLALEMVADEFPPVGPVEHVAVARTTFRLGKAGDALPYLEAAVAAGDSSVATHLLWGEVTEASGNRRAAVGIYETGAGLAGDLAAESGYRHARTLVRLRLRNQAYDALDAFRRRHPDHSRTVAALFLMADLRGDQGRRAEADSLFVTLTDEWPESDFASQARFRLAGRAAASGDILGATEFYRDEVRREGGSERVARYHLGRLAWASGDSASAFAEWSELARRDSIGYYGTAARQAAGLPDPVFSETPPQDRSPEVSRQLTVLDVLTEAGLEHEVEALIAHLTDPQAWEVDELLDIAEGLGERGRSRRAVALGWRIASLHRLNDPRVLRIIFPWPNRELVEREAEKFGLDPFLLVALIRQESAFDENATSRAGARGMMQLMPATARWLAGRLRIDWDHQLLAVADANVHLGAAHLSTILRQYDGEIVPALAAYNAGGSRARRWLRFPEARAGDWFAFIERVPFSETRGYLQTLIRNRMVYRALYGGTVQE